MIINNLTPQTLRVRLKEISGDKNEYDIFIQPHGSTEVSQVTVVNADPRLLAITSDPYQVPIPNTFSPVKDAIEEEPEKPVEEVVDVQVRELDTDFKRRKAKALKAAEKERRRAEKILKKRQKGDKHGRFGK